VADSRLGLAFEAPPSPNGYWTVESTFLPEQVLHRTLDCGVHPMQFLFQDGAVVAPLVELLGQHHPVPIQKAVLGCLCNFSACTPAIKGAHSLRERHVRMPSPTTGAAVCNMGITFYVLLVLFL